MTYKDRNLMNKIMQNKTRYEIKVDNDAVWVQDNNLDEEDENYWNGFDGYGWEFIIDLFEYLGFKAEGV